MSISRFTWKPSQLGIEGEYLVNRSEGSKVLIGDIKRVEVIDSKGSIVDSWGQELKESNKIKEVEESLYKLSSGDHSSITLIYQENNQVSSVNLPKSLSNISVINKPDGSIYININGIYINTNTIYYIVPTEGEKIKGEYITIREPEIEEGQGTIFTNPILYLNQYLI